MQARYPSDVIYGMKLLTSPENQNNKDSSPGLDATQVPNFDQLLRRNLESFDHALEMDSKLSSLSDSWNEVKVLNDTVVSSIRWRFVTYCLKTLYFLRQSLKMTTETVCENPINEQEESKQNSEKQQKGINETTQNERNKDVKSRDSSKLSEPVLGVQDQKVVKTVLQFVVCLGICPCLQTGVGIPLNMRSGFSMFVESSSESCYANQYCLYSCLKILLQCAEVSSLSTLILSQHLTDILAGLLQVIHVQKSEECRTEKNDSVDEKSSLNPGTEIMNSQTVGNENGSVESEGKKDTKRIEDRPADKSVNMTTEQIEQDKSVTQESSENSKVDINYCQRSLDNLINRVYPPLLVKTLLLLQGGPKVKRPPSTRAPVLPPAPVWLKRFINQKLTVIMMKPRGVQSVLRAMLDGPGPTTGTADWKRCDAIAKVIACCPLQSVTLEEFYKAIGPQVIGLIHLEDKQLCKQYLRIACCTLSNMAQKNHDLTRQYVISPIIGPLLTCSTGEGIPDRGILVTESALNLCIDDCHKVFVCGCAENPKLITSLQPVILTVYSLYVFTKPGVSTLKKFCHEIVVSFLKQVDSDLGVRCLDLMAFRHSRQEPELCLPRMHPDVSFQYGANGGVKVVVTDDDRNEETGDDKSNVECIVSILKDLKSTGLAGEFLVHMLKELTQVIQYEIEVTDQSTERVVSDSKVLLDGEQQHMVRVEQFYRKLMLLNVLASVCEELGPDCIQNATHALDFIKTTLERGVQVCKNTLDEMTEVFESETLSMAMGLLTATLTGAYQLTEENREFMTGLLPLLQEISSNHPESSVQEMATDIRIAIATHGAVWSDITKSKTKDFTRVVDKVSKETNRTKPNKAETKKDNKPKIEVIDEKQTVEIGPKHNIDKENRSMKNTGIDMNKLSNMEINEPNTASKPSSSEARIDYKSDNLNNAGSKEVNKSEAVKMDKMNKDKEFEPPGMEFEPPGIDSNTLVHDKDKVYSSTSTETKEKPQSELTQVYEELCDALLPVRGHGLIRLTRMIQRRDQEVLDRQDAVLTIFLENLDHSDSYMYLAAVSGLTALSDLCPDMVVPKLCEQFANFDQLGKKSGFKRKVELRMKIGEVLVKASRCLGDTIPKYRDILIHSFLVGTKDSESFIRASSLSNLGEICKLLRFSLGNVVQEVFECCSSMLRYDADKEARQAAGQAITLLLQGMAGDSFKVLEGVIKDLYRTLKQCMSTEKEDSVKVHVTLALNELDDIMRNKLFPTQKLEKRIRVLDFE